MNDESMVTPKQAARSLGISDQTVYRWIAAGLIRATTRGLTDKKRYLIPKSEVERIRREGNYNGSTMGKMTPALTSA